MLQTFKHLAKHSVIYGMGGVLNKFIAFFLLPIYTRYLTPADYGVLSLLGVTAGIGVVITTMGVNNAMFREILYRGSDEREVQNTALYFILFESSLIYGVLMLMSPQLSNLIFGTTGYTKLLRLTFLADLSGAFSIVALAKLRIHAQSTLYAILSMVRFIVEISLNLYFVVVLRRGLEGLVTAGVISAALFAAICLAVLAKDLQLTFSIPILRRMLSFGVPLISMGLSSLVLNLADRYFLQHFSTTAEVGLYSLGYNIGMVMRLADQAFQLAWPPHRFIIAKQPDAEQQFAKVLTYFLVIFGLMGLVLSVLAREMVMLMTTPKFYSAYHVVPLIVLAYTLSQVRHITNTGLTVQSRTMYIPPIIISSAILNLLLNYLLIPPYGRMGAAWATVISFLYLAVVQTSVNQRFWYIHYEYGRIARIALVWGITYGVSLFIRTSHLGLDIGLKLILLMGYPFLLYAFGFYEKEELAMIKTLLRSGLYFLRARRMSP